MVVRRGNFMPPRRFDAYRRLSLSLFSTFIPRAALLSRRLSLLSPPSLAPFFFIFTLFPLYSRDSAHSLLFFFLSFISPRAAVRVYIYREREMLLVLGASRRRVDRLRIYLYIHTPIEERCLKRKYGC